MAAGPFTFVTVDVFGSEKYRGNQLAIVSARNNALSQERKQQIAKEFNYSETAFLHDAEPGHSRRLDIFTRNEELNFGGQAAIGTAHYIFQKLENDEHRVATQKGPWTSTLLTKAGRIPIYFDPVRHVAAAEVPHNVHLHSKEVPRDYLLAAQPDLRFHPEVDKGRAPFLFSPS